MISEGKGFAVTAPEKPTKNKYEADVVVIGGGGAGLPAALSAADHGAKVIVLDKRFAIGGNALRANWIMAIESHLQKKAGIKISRDETYEKALEWHRFDRVNPKILRAFINGTADTVKWLEQKGVQFQLKGDTSHWTTGTPAGLCSFGWVYRLLYQRCHDAGVQFLLRTSGKKIIRGTAGNVTGVLAETRGGQEIEIKTRSVVLCPGSFLGNKELMKKYFPYYYDENATYTCDALLSNTGDGVKMAEDAGAALSDHCTLIKHPYAGETTLDNRCHGLLQPISIKVNKRGQRYLSEAAMETQGNVFIQQPGRVGYALCDDKIIQRLVEQKVPTQGARIPTPPEKIPDFRQYVQKIARQGTVVKISDNWDDIAKWIGCEPKVLKATIDEYNSFCDKGYDEAFAKNKKFLLPLRTPPYYAVEFHLNLGDPIGPVIANERMEVLDKEDEPIPGFYTAGQMMTGWLSYDYGGTPGGTNLAHSIWSGRTAGQNAAEYAARK